MVFRVGSVLAYLKQPKQVNSMKMSKTENFIEFFNQFLLTALWSSVDKGEPLDEQFEIADFSEEGIEILKAHALSFYSQCYYYVEHETSEKSFSDLGHDFWLTSCGHGAGFWDGDWPKYGETLTNLSKCYPLEHINLMEYLEN